ncbi:hypothetical protein AB1E19_015352 [Capra hircus]
MLRPRRERKDQPLPEPRTCPCSPQASILKPFLCLQRAPRRLPGEESASRAEGAGDAGSIPGSGRSPGKGHGNPLQDSCLENPTDRGAWRAAVQGLTESDLTERTHAVYRKEVARNSELAYRRVFSSEVVKSFLHELACISWGERQGQPSEHVLQQDGRDCSSPPLLIVAGNFPDSGNAS